MAGGRRQNAKEGEATPRPKVLLLPDEPADEDEFEAKAHNSVAKALAHLIENEPGGKVIGLEGSWGSGKSTIVRLLCKHLEGGKTRVVIFDAWGHQGDPLRRSFLEAVIDELERAEWLPDDTARKSRTKLTGRASTVHTKSTARLSLEGRSVSVAALLLPFGVALFANPFQTQHRLLLLLGALFLVGPLLVVLGFAVAKAVGLVAGGQREIAGWRRELVDLRVFSFFANEQNTETTTEGVELGEPTSVEFERLFSDVLNASMQDSQRLLVVLDNLDRVEESDARTLLATMQTFTGSGNHSGKSWVPNVWTLIPYDPVGLDRLWNPDSGAEGDRAAAFVEKVFQVRFEAPPLVLSDWSGYLLRLLQQALPGAHDDELQPVLRLRRLYPGAEPKGLVAQAAPTPRQLKQFVNQLGAIRRQRDDVPLVHVGYYALLRRDRIKVEEWLIAGTLPHKKLSHLFKEGLAEDLAALHFGTNQTLAQQLLLGRALDDAFAKGDSTTVKQLKDRTGFVGALESFDWSGRAAEGGVELTRAVAVLAAADAFEVSVVEAWLTWHLYPLVRTLQSWRLAGRETGVGLAILFDGMSSGDESTPPRLLTRVAPAAGEADTDGHLQLQGVAGLADELVRRGRADDSVRILVDLPAARMITSLAFFGTQVKQERSRALLQLSSTPAEVAEAFVEAATSDSIQDVQPALDVLMSRPDRIDLDALGSGCAAWLGENEPASAEQLAVQLSVVDLARRSGSPEEILGAAADDGTLMHLVSLANKSGWLAQAADASMLHLTVRPNLPDPQATREAAAGAQIVRQSLGDPSLNPEIVAWQLAWLQTHSGEAFDLLTQVAAEATFQLWVDHQLQGLSEASTLIVSADQYLQQWLRLRAALPGDGFGELTRNLFDKAGARKTILAGSADPALALIALEAIPESGNDYSADVRTWASGIVKDASATNWQTALATPADDPILSLAVALAGTAEAPSDPPGLSDALHSHFQALATGVAAWQPDSATFAKLTSLLGVSARKVLASELCAELEGRDGSVGSDLFTTYGIFLAGEPAFRSHAKLPNFIGRAVAHDEWGSVQWIVEVAQKHADTLQPKNRKEEIEHLQAKVSEKLTELSDAGTEPPAALTALSGLLAK